jgi:thioesterase domain-containing protein/acyl carrier protein
VAERMKEVVAEARAAFGEIHGVFHAAGVIRDNLIQLKSPRDIEDVFSAKIYGTLVLDEIFRDGKLDFMVLFSSASAYVAPTGQVDYVGASAFVNAFAESCHGQRPYPVTSIAWGIWKDVGMVGQLATPGDAPAAAAETLPVKSPHFERREASRDGLAQLQVLSGTLRSTDWVIDDHRLAGGEALLPGTGYLELIRAALAELGRPTGWQLANLVFESPLFVPDGGERHFRVSLRGDEQRWDVEVLAEDDTTPGRFVRCVSARVTPSAKAAPAPLVLADIDARCTGAVTAAAGAGSLRTRQEAHLRFGPRWHVLKRLAYGQKEALAHLQLAPEFTGDLADAGLHPGLVDIATGCAMDLIPGYAEQEVVQNLWAPISYRGLRFHAPLQAELHSWIRLASDGSASSDFAAFDVTLTDASGRVLAEVERLTLRRLDGPWQAAKAQPAADTLEEGAAEPNAARAKPLSPGEMALRHNVSQGITPAEGLRALQGLLNGAAMPAELIVSTMKIADLVAQAESLTRAAAANNDARFSRPELDSDFAPPRDAVEKGLAELWGKLLGVDGVGIHDSFFDLGGHSLIAVRLFNEITDKFSVDLPMSVLMQSPTIEGLATIVRGAPYSADAAAQDAAAEPAARGKPELRYQHVVPMHAGPVAGRTPLFVVAGMFGNVLNLSHLAHLLGEDRPFYALQARGLYGDTPPHESFEEAAADYIAEMVQVQPHGPYLLGGFSGGGLIAFEMARQLIARGEEVQSVVMLDTPAREIPDFSFGDKLSMLVQTAQREGLGVIRQKIVSRIEWEKEKRRRREARGSEAQAGVNGNAPNFQSQRIGDAFYRSLVKYKIQKLPVSVALFRPKLDVKFKLSGGRQVDSYRNYVREDNFWTPHVDALQVFEVPGNHDNMVLEPNVRVLVSLLRRVIDNAGQGRA